MKNYIVFNKLKKILRTGGCGDRDFLLQAKSGNFVMEGIAKDTIQQVEFDGFDTKGQPINPRVVDKTPAEILTDNPILPEIPKGKKPAPITNKQWQDVLNRLEALENERRDM